MKNFGIISIIIILFIIGISLFFDPLDELTRGCSCNDTYNKNSNGGRWVYYCKDKPWQRIDKLLYENSKYPNYEVSIEDGGPVGRYEWYNGEYHCKIYSSPYVHQDDRWYEILPGQRYEIYDDCCTKQEFVNRIKETLNSSEYDYIKADKSKLVEYHDWSEKIVDYYGDRPVVMNIRPEEKFESYRINKQKALEKYKK